MFNYGLPGKPYDSMALSYTSLWPHLHDGLIDSYWIAADNAYPLIGSLLKPFQGNRRADVFEDSFNYHLSSIRVLIENAFGVFIQRWGIFWRTLRYSPAQSTRIIMACVYLHNYIIDCEGVARAEKMRESGIEQKYFTFDTEMWACDNPSMNLQQAGRYRTPGYGSSLRATKVSYLRDIGLVRPHIA